MWAERLGASLRRIARLRQKLEEYAPQEKCDVLATAVAAAQTMHDDALARGSGTDDVVAKLDKCIETAERVHVYLEQASWRGAANMGPSTLLACGFAWT